ncbi:hypothetical protein F4778DRAFT_750106 [Xylariomycetidae sp. FL2044]|nr:hypothetical protein F4778DRAFT_750106 [Xylariomycetidae sp. FL2044]
MPLIGPVACPPPEGAYNNYALPTCTHPCSCSVLLHTASTSQSIIIVLFWRSQQSHDRFVFRNLEITEALIMSLEDLSSLPLSVQEVVLNEPALQPPPGVTPDPSWRPEHMAAAYPTVVIGLVVSLVFVLIRIHGKWYCMRTVKVHDILAMLAFGCLMAHLGIYFAVLNTQTGINLFTHLWNVRVRDLREISLLTLVWTNLYGVAMLCLKTAILVEWVSIFCPRGTKNVFYWSCVAALTLNTAFWGPGLFVVNFACIPHARIYDKTVPGHCYYDQKVMYVFTAAFNFFMDLVILALPQAVIWKLKLSFMKRIGLSFVFAVGLLACISAGINIGYAIAFMRSADVTFALSSLGLWAIAEMTCGFIIFGMIAAPKSFDGLSSSSLVSKLRARMTSNIEVSDGASTSNNGWRIVKPGTVESNTHTDVERYGATPSYKRHSGEAMEMQGFPARANDSAPRVTRTIEVTHAYEPAFVSASEQANLLHMHPWDKGAQSV